MTATTTCSANLRSGPGTRFDPPLVTLPAATKVTIVGSEGEWLRVRTKDAEGFIRKDLLVLAKEEVASGFLIHDPALPSWVLPPAEQVPLPSDCQSAVKT